jgi:hypothetical protein
MAAITTYATLVQAIFDGANNVEVEQAIPTFIGLAEARFNRELRTWQMIERSTSSTDDEYVALPTDFLQTHSLRRTGTTNLPGLKYVGPEEAKQIQARGETGDVRWFTIASDSYQLIPAPASAVELELLYYQKVPALSDSNTTNWLLALAPDAYLYTSLAEAADYLDDKRFDRWDARAARAIAAVQSTGHQALRQGVRLTSTPRPFA